MEQADIVYIYHLIDTAGRVRYVGKTNNPARRLEQHLSQKNAGRHLRNWIHSLHRIGAAPRMVVVRECSPDEWQQAEREEINRLRRAGAKLCNKTHGGEGRNGYTARRRKQISELRQELYRKVFRHMPHFAPFASGVEKTYLTNNFLDRYHDELKLHLATESKLNPKACEQNACDKSGR